MRKKLDTRFPAARIKKIMQADEEIGKIAMAVPLLVSKALELFLQDLCDRAYDITIQRGAKTLNSLHLKQCVQSFNVFDFLREIVGKVPDLGVSDAAGEDKSATKRRKVIGDDNYDSDDKSKRGMLQEVVHLSGSGRGSGRGNRGRGRGRPSNRAQKEATTMAIDVDLKENRPVRNFDLNLGLDENGNTPLPISAAEWLTMAAPPAKQTVEMKAEEYPGWLLEDMAIDPVKVANLNGRLDEEQEDYDQEEE